MAVARRVVVQSMVKNILLMFGGVVLVGGLVFGGLMLSRERLDYAGASAYVSDILAAEEGILEFLESEVGELDEDAKAMAAKFDEAMSRIVEYYKSLGASSALKNERVKEKYDELSSMIGNFREMRAVTEWLVRLIDAVGSKGYVEAGTEAQLEVSNDFLVVMTADLKDYLEKVNSFNEKYADGKASNYSAMTEEYGVILAEGEALEQKYKGVTLEDIMGVSVGDIRDWFESLRQMASILEEKK